MHQKVIQITAAVRQDRERSLAIWSGELDEFGDQVWIFLPKKQIRYEIRGATVRVDLPYWLAQRNNLLPSVVRRVDQLEERLTRLEVHRSERDCEDTLETRITRIEEHLGIDKSRH